MDLRALSLLSKIDPKQNTDHYFSSSIAKEDVSNTYALGANSFVTKPDDYEDLKSLMITLSLLRDKLKPLHITS